MSERKFVIETRLQLENLIFSLLEYGYFKSNKTEDDNTSEEKSYMLLDTDIIVDRMAEEIKMAVFESQEDLVVYCSTGALSFTKELLSKFKSFFVIKDIRLVMKFLVSDESMNYIFNNDEIRDEIYKLAGNLIFFDIDVYKDTGSSSSGYIFVKDQFFINYSWDVNGYPNTFLYSEKKSLLDQQSLICEAAFNQKTLTMQSSDRLGFEERMLDFYLTAGNKKMYIYASYIEAFCLSEEFLEKLIEKNNIQAFEAQMLRITQRSYSNLIKNKNLVINLSKRGFANSISKRQIILADITFTLNDDEFAEYIEGFKLMKNGSENVKVNLFDDRSFPFKLYEHGMSCFVAHDYVYFKKNPIFVDDYINGYFELKEKEYSNSFYKMTEELQEEEYFSALTNEELDEYIELLI